MVQYPLDTYNNRKNHSSHETEADRALRTSLEVHPSGITSNAANEDLSLNPLLSSSRRPLTPDLLKDDGLDRSDQESESAIDDVLSSGTWQSSSYLGPKRTADDTVEPINLAVGRSRTSRFSRTQLAIGAAGAGFMIARLMSGRNPAEQSALGK